MKIGELAKMALCSVETIRYYEKEALLPQTVRSEGNFRVYGAAHVERLRFIRNCRNLDMSHEEIRSLLALTDMPQDGCGGINDVFDQHITHVDQRIKELVQLKQQLTTLRQRCQVDQSQQNCGILKGLAAMEVENRTERHNHLG
jgi:Cd(II)/Pb(II)-responsive transcriptional regulator